VRRQQEASSHGCGRYSAACALPRRRPDSG
jgi:hypothetical protein